MRRACRRGNRRLLAELLFAGVLSALAAAASAAGQADAAAGIERGRYLVHAGGCLTCHTADRPDAIPLAGGRAIKTPYGTFHAPNLTPDPDTGLGGWTRTDLDRALREGVAPDGSYYYPTFPYPAYTGISDADVADIYSYLMSLAPVRQVTPAHERPWYLSSRLVMFGWNLLNFREQRFVADASRDDAWNRGAYLVRHLGHCGECHTPRKLLGGLDHGRELAGIPEIADGETVPGITSDPASGIGDWSTEDIVFLLETGLLPDGDFAGGSMSDVIADNTANLTSADRQAIAVYLKSATPAP